MTVDLPKSTPRSWAEWNGWPYLLIGLAVLLRLAHIWNSRSNPTYWALSMDPAWYDNAAQEILQGNWGPFPLFRAPFYPALLAAVYRVFGHDLSAARMLNVVLQAVTIWAIYRVGRSYFSAVVGVIAAALFAVNGMMIFYAGEVLTVNAETLASILLAWSLFRLYRDRSPATLILCGLAWGLAAITRPNFVFMFPIPLAVIGLLSWREPVAQSRANPYVQKLIPLAIWVVAAFAPILPITAANWIKSGEPVLIATQGGINFWIGNNAQSSGISSVLPGYGPTWDMNDARRAAEAEAGRPLGYGELSSFYYAKGWKFLASRPGESVLFMVRKFLVFFNRFEISNNKHIQHFTAVTPWLPPLLYLDFGVLFPLALLGAWVGWKRSQTRILVALTGVYAVSVALFFVTSRFRMPALPWMCLLAGIGTVWVGDRLRNRASLRQWRPLALLVPGAIIAWMNPWGMKEAPVGWARYMEGNAFLKLGKLDSARVCFMDTMQDTTAIFLAQLNLGVTAAMQENHEEARRWYEAALRRDSTSPDAWNDLGTTLESLKDTAGAIAAYRRALSLQPAARDPRQNLAGLYFRTGVEALKRGDDSIAVQNLSQSASLVPSAVTFYNMAIAYGRNGQRERALQQLDRALAIDPDFSPARDLMARLQAGAAYP